MEAPTEVARQAAMLKEKVARFLVAVRHAA
jgi:hypothetical protein